MAAEVAKLASASAVRIVNGARIISIANVSEVSMFVFIRMVIQLQLFIVALVEGS